MITFNDGKLNINSNRSVIELFLDLSFLLLFVVEFAFVSSQSRSNYLYYLAFFAVIGFTFLRFLFGRTTVTLKLPTVWYLFFILLCMCSVLWAKYSIGYTTYYFSRMLQVLVICYCITLYVRTQEDLERFMSIFTVAVLIMIISIYIRTPNEYIFTSYFGKNSSGYVTGNNINSTAYTCVIAIAIAFYRACFLENRGYYLIVAFELFTVALTGSRKALVMSLLLIFVMSVFYVRSRFYVLKILAILAAVAGVIVLIMKVPALYSTIGIRLERMMEFFVEDDATRDNSLATREIFGDLGKQAFYENPILGVGLGNAHYLIEQFFGYTTYMHNNYVEIASGLGTVGLVFYYWFYVYLIVRSGVRAYRGEKLYVMFFLLLLANVLGEIAMVTFYNYSVHIMLTISYCALQFEDEPERQYLNIDD